MRAMTILLVSAAIIFAAACGGSAPSVGTTPTGEGEATPGLRAGAGLSGFGGGVRAPIGVAITIDSCIWEPEEAGGPVQLTVAFTLLNEGSGQRFIRFRVQNTTGTIYRQKGANLGLTIKPGETGSRTLHTTNFPVGSQDLSLVFSDFGRQSETVPLDQCTQP